MTLNYSACLLPTAVKGVSAIMFNLLWMKEYRGKGCLDVTGFRYEVDKLGDTGPFHSTNKAFRQLSFSTSLQLPLYVPTQMHRII